MKFKIARPEDYPDTDGYKFRLAEAYAVNYTAFLTALIKVDSAVKTFKELNKDPDDNVEWLIDFLLGVIKEHEDLESI